MKKLNNHLVDGDKISLNLTRKKAKIYMKDKSWRKDQSAINQREQAIV